MVTLNKIRSIIFISLTVVLYTESTMPSQDIYDIQKRLTPEDTYTSFIQEGKIFYFFLNYKKL